MQFIRPFSSDAGWKQSAFVQLFQRMLRLHLFLRFQSLDLAHDWNSYFTSFFRFSHLVPNDVSLTRL